MNTPKCQICNWSNTGLLNLGKPNGETMWMCHGCIKRERDKHITALNQIEFYAATGILQDSFDRIKEIAKAANNPPTAPMPSC